MDIFEFAMEKEKCAEQHYRKLAERVDHAGLKSILLMLADEEAQHFKTVQQMQTDTPLRVTDTPVLQDAKELFEKMERGTERFSFDTSEVDLYRKACDIEAESKRYYLEKAQEVEDAGQKEVFLKLAEEENKHLVLVQGLCDFVAKPETFLEDAEFYHFDDYVEGEF
ncbi:MAG: ferritin family protein [Phycisphaerales bacterium]|nr:MAG: ferritin family protein [Phycisphaerales bacterium]